MKFASVRLVTAQFDALVQFYQKLSSIEARHLAPGFAEFHFEGVVLAISDERLIRLHNNGLAVAGSNRSAILEFHVADVAALVLQVGSAAVVMPMTKMPWGNTSALLQDPEGNLLNIFSTPE